MQVHRRNQKCMNVRRRENYAPINAMDYVVVAEDITFVILFIFFSHVRIPVLKVND